MIFEIFYTNEAALQRKALEASRGLAQHWKAVRKALGLMEKNLRHPSLETHKYDSIRGPNGEQVYETCAENKTPGAYRVFWHYGPRQRQITIIAIVKHPKY